MNHGGQKLNIGNVGEVTGFLQVVKPLSLHQLSHDLIGYLNNNKKKKKKNKNSNNNNIYK